jgi:hypothetical protein
VIGLFLMTQNRGGEPPVAGDPRYR